MIDTNNKPTELDFVEPEKESSIIKVIGVGGGGGNADKAADTKKTVTVTTSFLQDMTKQLAGN